MPKTALDFALEDIVELTGSCPYDRFDWERKEGCRENCGDNGFKEKDCFKKYYEAQAQETE